MGNNNPPEKHLSSIGNPTLNEKMRNLNADKLNPTLLYLIIILIFQAILENVISRAAFSITK